MCRRPDLDEERVWLKCKCTLMCFMSCKRNYMTELWWNPSVLVSAKSAVLAITFWIHWFETWKVGSHDNAVRSQGTNAIQYLATTVYLSWVLCNSLCWLRILDYNGSAQSWWKCGLIHYMVPRFKEAAMEPVQEPVPCWSNRLYEVFVQVVL